MDSILYLPHWSVQTLLFYLVLGVFPILCVRYNHGSTTRFGLYDFLWLVVWTIAPTFRVIQHTGVGGSDAYGYIRYFEICNNEHLNSEFSHTADDLGFQFINRLLNYICGDYHFFLFAVYAFEVFCFIRFCKVFCTRETNVLPFLLTPFLFVRSFSTLRSNLAITFFLLAMILLAKRKNIWGVLVAVFSVLVHKMLVVYVPFIFLFLKLEKIRLSRKALFTLFGISAGSILVIKQVILHYVRAFDFEGAYTSYIGNSSSFLQTWGIAFEQLVLGGAMVAGLGSLYVYCSEGEEDENHINRLLLLGCIYDILLVPICGGLGIWRGYEVMYLPRIVMWSIIISIWQQFLSEGTKNISNVLILIVLVAWLIFRYYSTWKSSGLMPFIFEFFQF